MKATIKDVARLARVSPSTVSRALHNNPRISEKVRERVRGAARELNFHPNPMARGLVNRQSRIVGVVFPGNAATSMGHPFYPAVIQGLGQAAGEERYHILLSTGGEGLSDEDAVREMVDSGYISGLLLLAPPNAATEALLSAQALPVVTLGQPQSGEGHCYVDNNNEAAGYAATRYLLDRGHPIKQLFISKNTKINF